MHHHLSLTSLSQIYSCVQRASDYPGSFHELGECLVWSDLCGSSALGISARLRPMGASDDAKSIVMTVDSRILLVLLVHIHTIVCILLPYLLRRRKAGVSLVLANVGSWSAPGVSRDDGKAISLCRFTPPVATELYHAGHTELVECLGLFLQRVISIAFFTPFAGVLAVEESSTVVGGNPVRHKVAGRNPDGSTLNLVAYKGVRKQ